MFFDLEYFTIKESTFKVSVQIAKKIKILRWKQEFIGDIDYDESLNYLFLPRNFILDLLIRILICRTSSQYRVLFTTIHQPPPRMMRTEYTVWTLVYFKLLTTIYYDGPCFEGWRGGYTSKSRTAKNLFIKYQN